MSRTSCHHVFALALAAGTFAVAVPAAAEPTTGDKAAAEGLFEQGRALMKEGKFEAACPKFVESQKLDPGVGTLLFLGECYERTGRIASAWATFGEARSAARIAGDPKRDAMAQQRYEKLEPLLPHLVVNVKEVPGLVVTLGPTPLSKGIWGTPIAVDPGDTEVRASAPGRREVTIAIHVEKGETKTIEVPALEVVADATPKPLDPPAIVPPPPAVPPPPPANPRPWQRPLGGAFIGVGAAGLVAGAIFGAFAFSTWSDAHAQCPNALCSSQDGIDASDRAHLWGNLSTGFFVAGGILAATGIVLFVTAPRSPRVGLTLSPNAIVAFGSF